MSQVFASRKDLLAAAGKRRFGTLDLAMSGLTVRYRSLSELELSEFEMEALKESNGSLVQDVEGVQNARARLIVRCLVDENGDPLLTAQDVEWVNSLDSDDTAKLYDVLREFVGLARRVRSAQAAADAAKKNSSSTAADGSPTS